MFVTRRVVEFSMAETKVPEDGLVIGWGTVNGRIISVLCRDFALFGGSRAETLPPPHSPATTSTSAFRPATTVKSF
jgi:acetyl-CoA carboxylase carboxyltransferase component